MINAAFAMLGLAGICFAVRLVIGPNLSDRVMGLDGLVIVGVSTVAIRAMSTGDGSFLPVLVVVTLVGFVGTAASARFIEGHSKSDHVVDDAALFGPVGDVDGREPALEERNVDERERDPDERNVDERELDEIVDLDVGDEEST